MSGLQMEPVISKGLGRNVQIPNQTTVAHFTGTGATAFQAGVAATLDLRLVT